jgi:hypothetical protein
MDTAALTSGLIAARMGQTQLALAAKIVKMNAEQAASIVQVLEAAQANMDRLVAAASGLGAAVDISV